jgi:hypothetical protein
MMRDNSLTLVQLPGKEKMVAARQIHMFFFPQECLLGRGIAQVETLNSMPLT